MHTPWVSFDGKDCSGCKHLNERGYCEFTACIIPCTVSGTIPEVKPLTNADRIRAMTDEELADWFSSIAEEAVKSGGKIDSGCWLNWLREEAT